MSVQRETMTDELEAGVTQERPWEAHAWLRAETLAALAELNEDCLDMLALQSATTAVNQSPLLVREVGALLRGMDPDARHRAGSCRSSDSPSAAHRRSWRCSAVRRC